MRITVTTDLSDLDVVRIIRVAARQLEEGGLRAAPLTSRGFLQFAWDLRALATAMEDAALAAAERATVADQADRGAR